MNVNVLGLPECVAQEITRRVLAKTHHLVYVKPHLRAWPKKATKKKGKR